MEIAGTGADGLEKAARLTPDLILLDMMLPDMNGMEVMERLSAEPTTSRIPVIIVTGASFNESQRKDLRARENFLRLEEKPVGMTDLLKVINQLRDAGAESGADSRPWPDIEGTICGY